MIKINLFHHVLLICVLGLLPPYVRGEAKADYIKEMAFVTLTGELLKNVEFGAPNYGENPATDAQELYLALWIKPVRRIVRDDGQTFDALKIQLIFDDSKLEKSAKSLLTEKKIKVSGRIELGVTGHHHEQVLLIVSSIGRADP